MILRRIARPLLSAIFISGGIQAFQHTGSHAEAAKPLVDKTVGKQAGMLPSGIPTDPKTLVRIDAGVKLAGGTLLAMGKFPRLSSLMLLQSLGWTTFAAHRFWEEKEASQRQEQMTQFIKNMSLAGGLLLASADTEGKPSIGWRAKHAVDDAGQQMQGMTGAMQHTLGKATGRAEKAAGKATGMASRQAGRFGRKAEMMTGRTRRKTMQSLMPMQSLRAMMSR